jgi:putative transcriptional regulator
MAKQNTPERDSPEAGYLTGQLLVAMPQMRDPRFARSVIYMCAHNADGAMGLVLNRRVGSITFDDLLQQLGIGPNRRNDDIRIHFGGPVEQGRGFVLHSADYQQSGTMRVDDGVALTATLDILKEMAAGGGPRRTLLALGYAGWGPGQLDAEIQANGWLQVPADEGLVFDDDVDHKWERAIGKIGVDFSMLSGDAGHA